MKRLLSQNSELRKNGIWNWSIPALVAYLSDDTKVVTCSACGRVDLLVQCSVGDYCCNSCLKESIEKPNTGDPELDAVLLALGVLGELPQRHAQIYNSYFLVFERLRVQRRIPE